MFCVTKLNSGGIQNYLLRFITHHKKELTAYVICKSGVKGEDLVDDFESLGVKIIPLRLAYFNFIGYWKLFKFLKKEQFDSICDFTGNFAALPLLIGKLSGIKKRIAFFRKDTNTFKETKLRLTYNKFLNLLLPKVTTKILSNSKSNLNFFFARTWEIKPQYEVIYNGINANDFLSTREDLRDVLNIPNDAYVTGHVGRYNEAKNHKTVIDVAIKLCKLDINNYFVFCGKNTNVFLKERVAQEGLEKQIKLLGERKDVIKVLNTLDCFYFPSLSEGQPNALIEALVAGLPFVASNIEPHKETIPESHYKQLIDPLDGESAIKKIKKIKEDKLFAKSLILKDWVITKYNPEILFNQFYARL